MISIGVSPASYFLQVFPGLRKASGKAQVCCPFHNDRTPSMSVDLDCGRFKCFGCGVGGDLIDFHQQYTGLDFKAAVFDLGGDCLTLLKVNDQPIVSRAPNTGDERARKVERARRIWSESISLQKGDPVDLYLVARAIDLRAFPESLRFHPALPYWQKDDLDSWSCLGNYPAMIAQVLSPDGELVAIHQTYLTDDGRKALVPIQRKLSGPASAGAIHLVEPVEILALAEGIETALAFHSLSGAPVWSCISTSLMEHVVIPPKVSKVIICVDIEPSGAGRKAGISLAERLHDAGLSVQIAIPPGAQVKRDWNDYLKEKKK